MLAYLVEDLVFKGKLNDAKGVCIRHDLHMVIRDEIRETLADTVYDPKLDAPLYDFFGPLSGETHFKLPAEVKVEWIGTEEDINKLDYLLTERYIGVDSEWRPALAKFHRTNPSLFQISGEKIAFLIDFVSLKDSVNLDNKLSQIFSNETSVIVGFSFNSDVDQFARKFPKLKFYRFAKNFIDVQVYYSKVMVQPPMSGLAKVTEKIFGKPLCKKEQMSNWERRPLRLSQQHYGALDAYILVELIKILAENGKESNHLVDKFIYSLDNRAYRPSQTEDDDCEEDGESATKFMGSRA